MMEDDKPFACTMPGCKMTFINEDHLEVHKKKHEFSLSLSPSASPFKSPLVDQTPTPTRFLDSSIFQDFHDNPFDATFRKANSQRIEPVMPEASNLNSNMPDPEPLSTPLIPLNNENDLPLFPLWKDSNSVTTLKPVPRRVEMVREESSDTLPFELAIPPHANSDVEEETGNISKSSIEERNTAVSVPEKPLAIEERNMVNGLNCAVAPTPVITSINHNKTATGVPTAVVVTRPATTDVPSLSSSVSQMSVTSKSIDDSAVTIAQQAIIQPVTVPPVVQLIIRLPDGRAIPVLIPNSNIGPEATAQATPAVVDKTVSNISPKTNSTPSLAKMKLKQVLESSQKAEQKNNRSVLVVDPRPRPNSDHVLSSSPPSLSSSQHSRDIGSESPPVSPVTIHRNAGRKRREIEDDPEEKRRKSLERNRAAATRCRQKRKQWIQTLGKKADELAATNVQLQNEVNMLRNEVAQLKTMLLAHKDCPVTQQQKATGCTEIIIPTAVPFHLGAPISFQERAQDLSSLKMIELMDTETSSSQSGNVSDTSEVSMRDR